MADANGRGFDTAVTCDSNGNVAEFAYANLFAVFGREIHTPAANGAFLNGITRRRVAALLREAEKPLSNAPSTRPNSDRPAKFSGPATTTRSRTAFAWKTGPFRRGRSASLLKGFIGISPQPKPFRRRTPNRIPGLVEKAEAMGQMPGKAAGADGARHVPKDAGRFRADPAVFPQRFEIGPDRPRSDLVQGFLQRHRLRPGERGAVERGRSRRAQSSPRSARAPQQRAEDAFGFKGQTRGRPGLVRPFDKAREAAEAQPFLRLPAPRARTARRAAIRDFGPKSPSSLKGVSGSNMLKAFCAARTDRCTSAFVFAPATTCRAILATPRDRGRPRTSTASVGFSGTPAFGFGSIIRPVSS